MNARRNPVHAFGMQSGSSEITDTCNPSYTGTPKVTAVHISNRQITSYMEDQGRVENLLEEIRDLQREQLEEYKRVTGQSLDMQKRAVDRQEQVSKIYRIALIVSAIVIAGIIAMIFYLLQYLPTRYR